jgi:hypothetical protein
VTGEGRNGLLKRLNELKSICTFDNLAVCRREAALTWPGSISAFTTGSLTIGIDVIAAQEIGFQLTGSGSQRGGRGMQTAVLQCRPSRELRAGSGVGAVQ